MSAVDDRRRSGTRRLARRVALRGPAWAAGRAVAWLGRPDAVAKWATGGSRPTASDARDDLGTLQQIADGANGPRVAERAAAVVQGLWDSSVHRAVLWGVCWNRPLLSTDALPLLLTPDPDSHYAPRVRLVSGLPDDGADPAAEEIGSRILHLACHLPDREAGDRVADVLRHTDHPVLLRLLATGFARALKLERSPNRGDRGATRLWSADRPQPLLGIVLANPHLPPPPRTVLGEFGRHERVVLQVLRDRVDLLDEELGDAVLVEPLLRYFDPPTASAPLLAASRRVLRALPPGPGREALCAVVLSRPPDARQAAAVAAVTDAGHLPADPATVPRFLLVTRQWGRYAEGDPTGGRMETACGAALRDGPGAATTATALLDLAADADAPAALRDAARRVLADVGPGPVRDLLLRRAAGDDLVAARIVDAQTERRFRPAAEARDAAAMNMLGLFLSERGEPDEAQQWYQRAVDAGNLSALNNMGRLRQNRGDTAAAAQWFRRAADAGSVLGMVNLGVLAMKRSDRAEAERWFRGAVDAGPQRRDVEGFRLFEAPGEPTPAEQQWTRAGDTAHVTAMCGLGELHFRHGELSDAETWWRRAAELGQVDATSDVGVVHERRGDLSKAEKWYRRAAAAGSSHGEENLRRLQSRRSDRAQHGFGSSDYGGGHYGGFGGSW